MFFIVGLVVVFGSVIGGYMMHHGNLAVLNQPNEFVIIAGAGIGSFLVGNSKTIVSRSISSLKLMMHSGPPVSKEDYIDLLKFLYNIFKLMKSKGMLAVESHIEDPEKSEYFTKHPSLLHNHHAVAFFCDYVRLITMGMDNKYQLEELMEKELEAHHHEMGLVSTAVVTLGDAFPALGIVAAVLGVITTMGSITEPPEILGGLIGAALVGTFLGVLLSYGVVGPMGHFLGKYFDAEHKYMEVIKAGLLAHIQGNAPAISIEFARKLIPTDVMPGFIEVEQAISAQ